MRQNVCVFHEAPRVLFVFQKRIYLSISNKQHGGWFNETLHNADFSKLETSDLQYDHYVYSFFPWGIWCRTGILKDDETHVCCQYLNVSFHSKSVNRCPNSRCQPCSFSCAIRSCCWHSTIPSKSWFERKSDKKKNILASPQY